MEISLYNCCIYFQKFILCSTRFCRKIVNNPRFLEAKRFASRTDAYSRFPIAQQGLRNDVPELTVVKEEHFKPKWHNQPPAWSPRRIADIASLSLEHWGERPSIGSYLYM